jgi:multidrug efflux pump subunit AcrB
MYKTFLRNLFGNPVLANLLMLLILICGLGGYMFMIRESFPRFDLEVINVTVAYPGADPEEIEEGIAIKIEEALEGIEGVKNIKTVSKEGLCVATIECKEHTDVRKIKDKIKNAVDSITTFPVKAENPSISQVEFRDAVCSVVLWGDLPDYELKSLAEDYKDRILKIKGISQASISGVRDYEISIDIPEDVLRKYNISFEDVSNAVRKNGMNLSAGTLKTKHEDIRLKAEGRRYSAKDYWNIPVISRPDGTIIRLKDIAKVKDSFDENVKIYSLFNGHSAVSINIYKTGEEDSINIVKSLTAFIQKNSKDLPQGLHITKFLDRSRMVKGRLHILFTNGIMGLCLVFISLWLFLDFRLSFWVAMGIPISLAGATAVMALAGASINMISMFGMIMVLGLIVDDAIVIGESIYHKRQMGASAMDAAINGTSEVFFPVVAAVLTTVIAFIPLFFIPGTMGKFIKIMPVPVVAALGISLIEGLFILPIHLRKLPPPGAPLKFHVSEKIGAFRKKISTALEFVINSIYAPFVHKVLIYRYITLASAIAFMLILAGFFLGGFVKYSLLPRTDDDIIRAIVELPPGTPAKKTFETVKQLTGAWKRVEKNSKFRKILGDKKLSGKVYGLIGSSVDWRTGVQSANRLEVNIELLPSEERNIYYKDIIIQWQKETGAIPGAIYTSFGKSKHGPGGMPIAVNLMGNNLENMLKAADELAAEINKKEGTFDVSSDYRHGERQFRIFLKPDASRYGLTLEDIARHVHSGFFGKETIRFQRGKDDIKVMIRYPRESGRDSLSFFRKLRIKIPSGGRVPFLTVAGIKLEPGQSIIRRKDRMRKIQVAADISSKGNANEIIRDLEKNFIPNLEKKYRIIAEISGQQSESRDSLGTLIFLFPLAAFGIYFIIASIFRSYVQPMVIMTTIPFGMIGAIIGHFIFNIEFCIFSMFGMVALTGIVVNDAIVFIECFNMNLEKDMPLFEALEEAGKRRFRAIMLTTLTTFSGLMPLILEKSLQAAYLKPMAASIAFGVLFATLVTLVLIPCFIVIFNDIKRIIFYCIKGRMPTRESMEARSNSN